MTPDLRPTMHASQTRVPCSCCWLHCLWYVAIGNLTVLLCGACDLREDLLRA